MYFKVICVVILGVTCSVAARDKLHFKIRVPEIVRHQHHDKYIVFGSPKNERSNEYYYETSNPYHYDHYEEYQAPQHHFSSNDFHSQNHYTHTPTSAKITQKPVNHKTENRYQFKNNKLNTQKKPPSPGYHYSNDNPYTSEPYTDGYKQSWKTLRTEKYETETVDNPNSNDPSNKYLVKGTYQVREKLPYIDTTVGYDREYQYPLSEIDHEYNKNEKVVDFNNAKIDPFAGQQYTAPIKSLPVEVKKPKNINYYYKYPSNDYEYSKNVQLVDHYLNSNHKNKDDAKDVAKLHEEEYKSDEFDYHKNDFEEPKFQEYKELEYDHLSSAEDDTYQKYKTDGPTYGYF